MSLAQLTAAPSTQTLGALLVGKMEKKTPSRLLSLAEDEAKPCHVASRDIEAKNQSLLSHVSRLEQGWLWSLGWQSPHTTVQDTR